MSEEQWDKLNNICISSFDIGALVTSIFKLENRFNALGYLIESRNVHDYQFLNSAIDADIDADVWEFLVERLFRKRLIGETVLRQILRNIANKASYDKQKIICHTFMSHNTQKCFITAACKYTPQLIKVIFDSFDDGNILWGFVKQYITDEDQFADIMYMIADKFIILRHAIMYECCLSFAPKHLKLMRKLLIFKEDIICCRLLDKSLFIHALRVKNYTIADCMLYVNDLSQEKMSRVAEYLHLIPYQLFKQIVSLRPDVLNKCQRLHKLDSKALTHILLKYPDAARSNYIFHKCMGHKTQTSHLIILIMYLVDQIDVRDNEGMTPMHHAFSIHEWHHVNILAANGSNAFFMRDNYGRYPIMCAVPELPNFVLLEWTSIDPMFIYAANSSCDYIASYKQNEITRISFEHLNAPTGVATPETSYLGYVPNREQIKKDAMDAYLSSDIFTLIVNYSVILEKN